MRTSEQTAKVSDALVKANLLLTNPRKDRTVSTGSYSYRYVDLAAILDDVRPILQAHQLAIVQGTDATERGVAVTTRLVHASGEWIEFGALVMPAGGDAKAVGSAITYARRYALCAALGIAADEDDDGAKASPVPQSRGENAPKRGATGAPVVPDPEPVTDSRGESGTTATSEGGTGDGNRLSPPPSGSTSEGVGAPAPSDDPSEAVSGGEYGEGSTPAPASDDLIALLEAVGGSEVKAINAVNKAMHTNYRKADLESLEPEDWAAGLHQVRGGR